MFKTKKVKFFLIIIITIIIIFFLLYVKKEPEIVIEDRICVEEVQKKEYEEKLQIELMKQQAKNSENFVSHVLNQTQLVVFRQIGTYKLAHDKTPNGNSFSEWLCDSQLTLKIDYTSIFTIDTNNIHLYINDNNIISAVFEKKDILISAIDISNVVAFEKKSIFGLQYTPIEITSLEKIAKDEIYSISNTKENINIAALNLRVYLLKLAKTFNVNIDIIVR